MKKKKEEQNRKNKSEQNTCHYGCSTKGVNLMGL